MRRIALTFAVAATLSGEVTLAGAASAQVTTPAPTMGFGSVPPSAVLSYNLIGLNVYNGANENVGTIKDLVIDSGKLAGYILSVGGFLGISDHYVVVEPASVAVNYDPAGKKWKATVNATKDQLKDAPEFKYEDKFKS